MVPKGARVATLLVVGVLAGCGEDEVAAPAQPDPAVDEAAITEVLIENEIGGPERCTEIYTDAYLKENWGRRVTAYGGSAPLEKCELDAPYLDLTEDDVQVVVKAIDGDTAEASAKVRAQSAVGFTLIRDGDSWRIAGFSD